MNIVKDWYALHKAGLFDFIIRSIRESASEEEMMDVGKVNAVMHHLAKDIDNITTSAVSTRIASIFPAVYFSNTTTTASGYTYYNPQYTFSTPTVSDVTNTTTFLPNITTSTDCPDNQTCVDGQCEPAK